MKRYVDVAYEDNPRRRFCSAALPAQAGADELTINVFGCEVGREVW